MVKLTIEAEPRDIAALVEAIQVQPEIRAIAHKRFEDLTTADFARLNELECAVDHACSGIDKTQEKQP